MTMETPVALKLKAFQGDESGTQRVRRPLVGTSPAMSPVLELIRRAAESEATVLLHGETGTGKEASAAAIHAASRRREGPFIIVDCGALPPQLLESELFGHERGSFTGAVAARKGAFEAASGGTIFLDEIGELPLDMQPKLLRALENREVKRVGSNVHVSVDVRVIAATNRDVRAEVAAGRFRSDLYYRLAVVQIALPPLRNRLEDLPALVDHLLGSIASHDTGLDDEVLAKLRGREFLDELAHHPWWGNIRELRNHLERCVALRNSLAVTSDDGFREERKTEESLEVDVGMPLKVAREAWVSTFERRYLRMLLERHGDSVSAAARAAGVDRIHFYRLLWKHGLRSRESDKDA